MTKSRHDITSFVDFQSGEMVGNIDFALPSLYEGMSIKMLGGSRDHKFIVKSWEYIFSEEIIHGLVVSVEVIN